MEIVKSPAVLLSKSTLFWAFIYLLFIKAKQIIHSAIIPTPSQH